MARHAHLDIAAPGQRIVAEVLHHAVQSDGNAAENGHRDQSPNLMARADACGDGRKDNDVGEHGVGALQSLIGTDQANARRNREQGREEVDKNQKKYGKDEGPVPKGVRVRESPPAEIAPAFLIDETNHPGCDHQDRD